MLDAMACAKPVVITHRRSLDDYLSAGAPVTTVPAGDAPALRSAIESVLASPDESRRLGAAGRELIAQRFNTRAMAADLARVFFEVSS
jgi:glycosyltransferase involved in cell wall biosynthesis